MMMTMMMKLALSVDGEEITYSSSFNSGASVSVRRRRYRRDVEDVDPLDDLDLDETFDPQVVIVVIIGTRFAFKPHLLCFPV